jgi:hypothetical protein
VAKQKGSSLARVANAPEEPLQLLCEEIGLEDCEEFITETIEDIAGRLPWQVDVASTNGSGSRTGDGRRKINGKGRIRVAQPADSKGIRRPSTRKGAAKTPES